jgi:hypothetical protein
MSMPSLYLEYSYDDSTKPEIVHLTGVHFGLPKAKMPAFALRTPLALRLFWQQKSIQQLC